MKRIWLCLLVLLLSWSFVSCSRPKLSPLSDSPITKVTEQLSEVAMPPAIQQLRQSLEQYQPQVTIVSPQPNQVIEDTTISVQLQVQDLPIFKDEKLGMGPHLHLILDNQPYQAVYNLQPVVFEDLSPGTHTLRVFASRPWHESFKNEGAYAQTTFHIYTQTDDNAPASLPLLTYSRPKGSYGAEPIMLDFYLTNAPLHMVAQENSDDEIADWRIRVTINGQSFLLDSWQPVYLKGFKSGKNWVKVEFIDEQGNKIDNAFNTTARLITFDRIPRSSASPADARRATLSRMEHPGNSGRRGTDDPKGQDTLSQLVRGELSAAEARSIVDPNYQAPVIVAPPAPEVPAIEEPIPEEPAETEPLPTVKPEAPASAEAEQPIAEPEQLPLEVPAVEPELTTEALEGKPRAEEEPMVEPETEETGTSQPQSGAKKEFRGIFNRFRRPPQITPSPSPEPLLPEIIAPKPEESEPEPISIPDEPAQEEMRVDLPLPENNPDLPPEEIEE